MKYDYIVVGGGSAGCVMAHRLSADPANQILLVEAGMDTPPDAVPADILNSYHLSQANAKYKWSQFRAYHQPVPHNDPARPSLQHYDQGRVMGGGSSINFQAANRGSPDDYNEWESMGADGWGWDDVLPFFRKLETDQQFDGPLHGKSGPLPIRRVTRENWSGFSKATADSFALAGMTFFEDQNGGFEDGYFPMTVSNLNDQRVSAAIAYLDAATRARPNLTIRSNAGAKRIRFEGRQAIGVELDRQGAEEFYGGSEIIISAGASHSPALLMRSGVGPALHLRDMGIDIVADLAGVGQNLQDHPGVPTMAYMTRRSRHGANPGPALQVGARYSSEIDGWPQRHVRLCDRRAACALRRGDACKYVELDQQTSLARAVMAALGGLARRAGGRAQYVIRPAPTRHDETCHAPGGGAVPIRPARRQPGTRSQPTSTGGADGRRCVTPRNRFLTALASVMMTGWPATSGGDRECHAGQEYCQCGARR